MDSAVDHVLLNAANNDSATERYILLRQLGYCSTLKQHAQLLLMPYSAIVRSLPTKAQISRIKHTDQTLLHGSDMTSQQRASKLMVVR